MKDAPVQTPVQDKTGIVTAWIIWLLQLTNTVSRNELQALPVHADNAAAVAAGLSEGTPYRTATGQVMVVY